ncbi:enzymatic polyprotein endonuclease reverse [Lasius niger]|uniref:RNA-directed DNA polymerase n=1 Tax=Lasius niger TaxID=67767 RepID=A0A0J7N3P8_LASNI|nr:enzymatic polyprotein endonuclease reverse [Lasius niger]
MELPHRRSAKNDGTHRFCIDFRKLNAVSRKDAYPLPHIAATLDKLRGARYLSTLDLRNGYWQVSLAPESRAATAFTVPGKGLMQFKTMPFGLHSAPATFQRLLDSVLGPELKPNVLVYLDDIVVASRTFDEHLEHLAEVFRRLRSAKLRVNTDKCHFCLDSLKYLGHIVDRQGIRTDPSKMSAITNWPTPTSLKQVRQFLDVASWYRRFIADFSTIAAPLTRLTCKNARWVWTEAADTAFCRLKKALTSAPVLACPDFNRPFILQTDASAHGLGAVLTQQLDEGKRVIAYASRILNPAERNYSATELECLAVVWGICRMRDYCGVTGLPWSPITSLLQAGSAGGSTRCNRTISRLNYQLRNGHLHRHILHELNFREIPTDDQWKRCIPTPQRQTLLERLHDDPAAGHLGIAKTMVRIAQLYYWPGMFRDIARYVRACTAYMAHKASQQRPAGNLQATPVTAPWQQVSIDLVGPLPRSNRGHNWLLTLQDRFTKWIEVAPLRKATAENVTRALTDRLVYWHGCPQWLISDNGTQLKSMQLENLLTCFGIRHRVTPPYTPQCNPVERERHYNLRRRNWRPQIGEWVWKKNRALSDKAKAFNAKLAPQFVGPLEVRKIISPVIVDLRDAQGRWNRHIHLQELKSHTGA